MGGFSHKKQGNSDFLYVLGENLNCFYSFSKIYYKLVFKITKNREVNLLEEKVQVTEAVAENKTEAKASSARKRYLRPKEIFAYCFTALGTGSLTTFVGNCKQYFMMNFMGISGSAYGLLTAISTIWDALDDPISGVVIDRIRTRWGRLRPFLIGPIPLWAITTILFFTVPSSLSTDQRVVYAIVLTIINGIGHSYLGGWSLLLYNITPNTEERSSLIATQKTVELFNYLPALVPFFVDFIPKISKNAVNQPQIYNGMSYIFVLIAIAACIFGFFNMRERIPQADKETVKETSILKSFGIVFKNRPVLALMLANFCGSIGGIRGSTGEDFFWMNCTGKLSNRFLASLFTGLPNYITTPMAPKIINKFGVRKTAIVGSLFTAAGWITLFIVGYAPTDNAVVNFCWITLCLTILGIPNRIIGVCDPLLLGDVYDYMEWKHGMRNEGVVNAVNGYVGKLSGSVIGLLSGVVYDIIKYTPQLDEFGNATPHTDPDVLMGLFAIFALIPAVAKLGYALSLLLFNVHGEFKEKMNEDLAQRRLERAEKE